MATNQQISTMATPLLVYNYRIVFEAIDPATGDPVADVTVTNPVLSGINLSETPTDQPEQPSVQPLFLPEPVNQQDE